MSDILKHVYFESFSHNYYRIKHRCPNVWVYEIKLPKAPTLSWYFFAMMVWVGVCDYNLYLGYKGTAN